jgi:hypothetical protein
MKLSPTNWLLVVLALLFSLLSALRLEAQFSRGAIVGTVRDPAGAAVPQASVHVTNEATNVTFRTFSEPTGDFYAPSLISGVYRVEVEKEGFKKFTASAIRVEVNQTVRVDITLELGPVTERIEVAGVVSQLQTDSATLGQVISHRAVTELPLNGRDFTGLLKLNVGVTELQGGITTAPSIRRHGLNDNYRNVSVNGARPSSISYLIDGVNANEGLFQTLSVTPPIDVIEEFKLQNGIYSAEYGMGSAQVNLVLRPGTNHYHGSLWEFLRNNALQPTHPFFHTKPPLKQNQFGAAFGGPIQIPKLYHGRDRAFFFASYQGGRRRSGALGQVQVPTEMQKQGDFSDWPTQLFDPLSGVANPGGTPAVSRQAFPGNRIPRSRFAPQSSNLLQYFPQANTPCALPCPNFTRGFAAGAVDTDAFTLRGDYNLSESDRIFGQLLWQNETAPNPSIMPLSGTKVDQRGRLAGLMWTHVFSPRALNEARVGYNRFYFLSSFETAFGPVNFWKEAGLRNLRDDPAYYALPAIGLGTGYSGIGNGGSVPFFNISNIFQYSDVFTLTRGRHTLKAGADIRRNRNMNLNGFGGNGFLNFTGQFTALDPLRSQTAGAPGAGNAFADFLLGYMSGAPAIRFTAFDQSYSQLRNTDFMFFYQHDVRVTPQLTLNLGLRWELHTPFHDKNKGGSIFDFAYPGGRRLYADRAFTEVMNNPIYFACCASGSLIATDWRDFAPRVGLAWRPLPGNNRLVLRMGYGIFYDILHNFYPTQSVAKNIPFASPTLPNPVGTENPPPLDIRNMFPAPISLAGRQLPEPYCQAPSQSIIDPATGATTTIRNFCSGAQTQLPDNRTPYTQHWGMNIQHQLMRGLMVEVGYQGSHGLRLPIQWIFNQAVLPPETGNPNHGVTFRSDCPPGTYPDRCSPIQDRVRYRNFLRNAFANANILQSVYHAMTVKVDKRFSDGLSVLGSFTWSRAIDQFSEIQAVGGSVSSIAPYAHNMSLERGPSNFDQTRRLVISWVYELPVGRGKKFLNRGGIANHVFGGWQANGIVTVADGTPFTVGCFCGDRSQTGNIFNTQRPNVNGNPLPPGFRKSFEENITQWFDTSVFSLPTLGTLGTAGRNILRSTGQRATDFSAFKKFSIREGMELQFRSEFFNLFSSKFYFPLFPNNNFSDFNFGSFIAKPRPGQPPTQDAGIFFNPRVIQFALRLTF